MNMPNNFTLILDTTAPSNPTIAIEGGQAYATQQLVNTNITCADTDKTNYQMKIWGDVDLAFDVKVQAEELNSEWMTYASTKQIKLSPGSGQKTVYIKVRDDVYNESSQANDSISLDVTIPVVEITPPAISKISKNAGKNTASFSFTASEDYLEYKVCVVAGGGDAHDTGTIIPTTGGSTGMGGTGTFTGSNVMSCIIKGSDLQTASSVDGQKVIKVFVRDTSGQWSA
jgi:hypothetical protein